MMSYPIKKESLSRIRYHHLKDLILRRLAGDESLRHNAYRELRYSVAHGLVDDFKCRMLTERGKEVADHAMRAYGGGVRDHFSMEFYEEDHGQRGVQAVKKRWP